MQLTDYYERFKRWFTMEGVEDEPILRPASNTESPSTNNVLYKLNEELLTLKEENARLKDTDYKRKCWLEDAKESAGYDSNTSFDIVWAETLELANKWKEQERGKTTEQS